VLPRKKRAHERIRTGQSYPGHLFHYLQVLFRPCFLLAPLSPFSSLQSLRSSFSFRLLLSLSSSACASTPPHARLTFSVPACHAYPHVPHKPLWSVSDTPYRAYCPPYRAGFWSLAAGQQLRERHARDEQLRQHKQRLAHREAQQAPAHDLLNSGLGSPPLVEP
jgi:hypothetical protein